MTEAEHAAWLTTLVMQVGVNVLLPLLVLGILVVSFWVLLTRAQADPKFDIADIFRDDSGKVSMTQIIKLGAFGIHAFMSVIALVIYPNETTVVLAVFSGTWGPTSVAFELIKRKWPMPIEGAKQ